MSDSFQAPENRKRSMDRRRESSRCAAKDRRDREGGIFADLRDAVPLVDDGTPSGLDRIAMLRVAAAFCKFRKEIGPMFERPECLDDLQPFGRISSLKAESVHNEDTMTECLDGFMLITSADGLVLYVSESVVLYLGLTQTEVTGKMLDEFMEREDFEEFLKSSAEILPDSSSKSCAYRMKTIISPRGRNLNMKSALPKPVTFVTQSHTSATGGSLYLTQVSTTPAGQGSVSSTANAISKCCSEQLGTYMTRHTCDMRFSYISDKFNYVLKNDIKGLVGTSFYDLVHPADCQLIEKSMKELFVKGFTRTPYYRLVTFDGSMIWLISESSTVTHTTKGQKGTYVISVHQMLGTQNADEPLLISTDASPAGVPVLIKKEIDDGMEYMGRQPEVIEPDFVPMFADSDLDIPVMDTLCPPTNPLVMDPEPSIRRNSSFDAILGWILSDDQDFPQPRSSQGEETSTQKVKQSIVAGVSQNAKPGQGQVLGNSPTCATALATSTGMATVLGATYRDASEASYSQFNRGGSALNDACNVASERYPSNVSAAANSFAYSGAGPMASGLPTDNAARVSPLFTADFDSVSAVGEFGSAMYAAVSPADPTGAQDMNFNRRNNNSSNNNNNTQRVEQPRIVENLRWEEPNLGLSLAPFIPDDDENDFNSFNDAAKEIDSIFEGNWTAAQPLVPVGRQNMQNMYQPYVCNSEPSQNCNFNSATTGANGFYRQQQPQPQQAFYERPRFM